MHQFKMLPTKNNKKHRNDKNNGIANGNGNENEDSDANDKSRKTKRKKIFK